MLHLAFLTLFRQKSIYFCYVFKVVADWFCNFHRVAVEIRSKSTSTPRILTSVYCHRFQVSTNVESFVCGAKNSYFSFSVFCCRNFWHILSVIGLLHLEKERDCRSCDNTHSLFQAKGSVQMLNRGGPRMDPQRTSRFCMAWIHDCQRTKSRTILKATKLVHVFSARKPHPLFWLVEQHPTVSWVKCNPEIQQCQGLNF